MGYHSRIMTMETKNNIFKEHLAKYLEAEKQAKGAILKHVCFVTSMHRKAAIRKFRALQMKHKGKQEERGRAEYYTADVTVALKDIWKAGNEVCGELLHPMIAEYVSILKRDKLWDYAQDVTGKLISMSMATVKRRVGHFKKAKKGKKGLTDTKPSHLKYLVPIFLGPWTDKPPGFGQIDTVRHSNSAYGDAVYTLNYTDAATLTVIPHAQFNKGKEATRDSMKTIKVKMPFKWLGAHPDTGSEFINQMVVDWCGEEKIDYSRSRPNHKNDNMHVEERNGHVIRRAVGYQTLDCREAADALNEFYDVLTPYLLHFVAVRRQTSKERLNSKYRRTYEKVAKTPYQRILEHKETLEEVKVKLKTEHEQLNPLILKQKIDRLLRKLYDTQKRYGNQN
jgi:hypothetical protein